METLKEMKKDKDRSQRLRIANHFLQIIGTHGRQFFNFKGEISRFEIWNGHIYFIDSYTRKSIYLSYKYWQRGFTQGGTMRALVNALADYIRGKRTLPIDYLGPWHPMLCDGDLWGYGDSMEEVRKKCIELEQIPK